MAAKGHGARIYRHRGWQLVETIYGWYAEKGGRRVRVGSSREEHTEALDRRFRALVDERERGDTR